MSGRMLRPLNPILLGGFVAGTIDIGAACLIYRLSPEIVLRAIAQGVLGPHAFDGGWRAPALGLLLQWVMSIVIAACCVVASERVSRLKRSWRTATVVYGVVIFLVMNYVVVPLSAVGKMPHFTPTLFMENLLAMLLFACIIVWTARRFESER
jgi:uncharacterized membrane protein YagU involved in acid resistance